MIGTLALLGARILCISRAATFCCASVTINIMFAIILGIMSGQGL